MKRNYILGTVAFSFALLFLMLNTASWARSLFPAENTIELVVSEYVSALVTAALYYIAAIPLKRLEIPKDRTLFSPRRPLFFCVIVSIASLAVLFALSFAISFLPGRNTSGVVSIIEAFRGRGWEGIAAFVSLAFRHVLVPAIAEELYFRKKLTDALMSVGAGSVFTIAVTSVLFALLHGGATAPVMTAAVSGAVLWILYRVTGRIRYPIAVHFIYNLSALVLLTVMGR